VGTIAMVDGRPLTSPEAADTLTALVTAIRTCGYGPHRIVMTSRYAPNLSCVRHFKVRYLRALGRSDTDRLMARLVDSATGQTADTAGLGDIRDVAGGNPRLIEWLVDIANHEVRVDLDALRAALRDKRLDFLENNIFAPMLLDQLSAADRRLLEAAAPFEQSVPAGVLARLGYTAVGDATQRARRLADLGLLEQLTGADGSDRFAVPGVLRPQFMVHDDPEANRTRYAACARELAADLGDFTDVDARVLDRAVLREVHRLAGLGANLTLALDTAVALAGIELFWLRFSAAKEICEDMLVRREDHRLYLILAEALIELGRPCWTDTASKSDLFFDRALDLCPPDTPADRAEILASRGFWANSYLPGPGLPDLDEALELVDRVPHSELSRAGVLLDRAIALHLSQDDLEAAYRDLAAALTIDNEVGTTAHQAITLLTMADAALAADRPDLAEQWVEEATLRSTIKRVRVGAEITRGEIAWDRDDVDRARKHYEAGLRLARLVGSLRDQLGALSGLRRVYVRAADSAAVERVRREQDEVVRQLRSPMSRIGVLIDSLAEERKTGTIDAPAAVERAREAATLAAAAGRKDRELEAWQLFLDDAGAADVPAAELEAPLRRLLVLLGPDDAGRAVRTAVRLGRLLLRAERFAEAQPVLEEALQHYERHGLRESSAELHERLSEIARGRQQPADAERHLRAAALGRLEVGSYAAAARSLRTLAAIQRDRAPALARDTLVLARRLARLAPSALDEEQVLIDLVALADMAAESASSQRPGDAEQPTDALRQQARSVRLRAQTLQVDVGSDLIRHVDPNQGGRFLTAVESLRVEVETEEGWTLPRLQVGVDPELGRVEFVIRVWGESIVRDAVGDSVFGDPASIMIGRLRTVARMHQEQLQGPEPPPPFEADVDTRSATDIIAALREQP
ncbi:MAG: FHIPEP family type III secretion protein, partial [Pseudonocardiaceae bacterium]